MWDVIDYICICRYNQQWYNYESHLFMIINVSLQIIFSDKMISISLYVLSAVIILLFEYFILLRLYKRSPKLQTISLIVAPLMIIIALLITQFIQNILNITKDRLNPVVLFVVLILLELPLSLYGYELIPNASILERMIVAGVVGVSSVLIAQGILGYF